MKVFKLKYALNNKIARNRKFLILIILGFTLLISSCEKIINIDPPASSLEQNTVFTNDAQANAALESAYQFMSGGNFASGGISSVTCIAGLTSDELVGFGTLLPIYQNNISPSIGEINGLYSGPYRLIYIANSILEGLSLSNKITPKTKAQIQGEAFFIRAFAYYYLTNMFGEVPLQLTTDYRVTSIASKTSQTRIYEQIIADLRVAEQLVEENYPTQGRIRPNKAVVQALLARAYLFNEDWLNSEKYSSLIIDRASTYSLVGYNDVFLSNSNEAIWQLKPIVRNTYSPDGELFIPTSTVVPPIAVSLNKDLVLSAFGLDDKRRSQWIKSFVIGSETFYYPYKYKANSLNAGNEQSMVFRLAEQYLIRAESNIKLGNIALGIADLNIIRQRPLLNGTNANDLSRLPATLSMAQALDAVALERRLELFSEWGHRWFDLKRTGRAKDVLSSIKTGWQLTDQLYPIPSDELKRNRNITQNDGY